MQGIEVIGTYNNGKKCFIPHNAIACVAEAKYPREDENTTIYLVNGARIATATKYETIVAMLEDPGDE